MRQLFLLKILLPCLQLQFYVGLVLHNQNILQYYEVPQYTINVHYQHRRNMMYYIINNENKSTAK